MIGRVEEIKKIEELLASKRSEFLAVTGRRRVGKTYLVDSLLKEHYCFTMTGIQKGSMQMQLVNFGDKLAEYSGTQAPTAPANWQDAFRQLKAYLQTLDTSRKQVIFIDELPWVSTPRSGFLQLLAHLWNDYLSKESHFVLVICGSATSWITKNIFDDQGGLHNRVTEVMHLYPFTLDEASSFLKSNGLRFSPQETARIYMSLGGIPFYLEKIRRGESFAAAIERICFAPGGILKNEYQNLYKALFNNAEIHQTIVEILAQHPRGMTRAQMGKKSGLNINSGSYQRAIKELIQSDFVKESAPFGRKKRGSIYHLIDEYSIFYYRFIKPNSRYTPGMWQQLSAGQSYKVWAGYAFESLCFKHVSGIKQALGIGGVYTEVSALQVQSSATGDGFQIDLIIDRKDDSINLCEIKFHEGPFSIKKEYYQKLISKRQRFIEHTGTRKQVFLTFITNHGVAKNEYALELVDTEVVLEDLC